MDHRIQNSVVTEQKPSFGAAFSLTLIVHGMMTRLYDRGDFVHAMGNERAEAIMRDLVAYRRAWRMHPDGGR